MPMQRIGTDVVKLDCESYSYIFVSLELLAIFELFK